jgi:hypothetical protein
MTIASWNEIAYLEILKFNFLSRFDSSKIEQKICSALLPHLRESIVPAWPGSFLICSATGLSNASILSSEFTKKKKKVGRTELLLPVDRGRRYLVAVYGIKDRRRRPSQARGRPRAKEDPSRGLLSEFVRSDRSFAGNQLLYQLPVPFQDSENHSSE